MTRISSTPTKPACTYIRQGDNLPVNYHHTDFKHS